MGDGAVMSRAEIDAQSQWITSLMTPGGAKTAAPTHQAEPSQQAYATGDKATQRSKGTAATSVALTTPAGNGQQLKEPPDLFTNDKGQVVTGDGQPYLGMEIYQAQGYVDAKGQGVDLDALMAKQGLKPEDLAVNEQNQVVKADGSPAFAGQTITVVSGYVDSKGNAIDLEAEERKRGIGAPAATTSTTGTTQTPDGTQPAADPNAAMMDYDHLDKSGRPQVVYPDGKPYLGRELYVDEATGNIFDKDGKTVDPATLGVPQGPTPEEAKLAKNIQRGTALASGAFNLYMNRVWYNSTLQGMQGRLQSLQRATTRFNAGTSIQGKLAANKTPVLGGLANKIQVRRDGKIDKLTRNIKLQQMTPAQEAKFMAKEKLTALKAESKAFQQGKSMLGKMKNAPVVGTYAKKVEANRQVQIRQISTQIRTGKVESTWKTKVANATRGRVMPALMAIGSGWSTYTEIRDAKRRADDPTNVRKWDDYARITGGAVQTGGALMALKRGNVKGAIITATAGTVISTVGEFFRD